MPKARIRNSYSTTPTEPIPVPAGLPLPTQGPRFRPARASSPCRGRTKSPVAGPTDPRPPESADRTRRSISSMPLGGFVELAVARFQNAGVPIHLILRDASTRPEGSSPDDQESHGPCVDPSKEKWMPRERPNQYRRGRQYAPVYRPGCCHRQSMAASTELVPGHGHVVGLLVRVCGLQLHRFRLDRPQVERRAVLPGESTQHDVARFPNIDAGDRG